MAFLDDKSGATTDRPTEYCDIALSTGKTYRIASGNRDLQVGNLVYKAEPLMRTEISVPQASDSEGTLTLSLPSDHPAVERWFMLGVPPRQTAVTLWQKQERSGEVQRIWGGLVTSVSCDGGDDDAIAKLLVPARSIDTMRRSLPTISNGRSCPHIWADTQCRIDRNNFKRETTAILVDGRTVRVDMGAGHLGDWAELGELVHVATGERMTVSKQTNLDPAHTNVADLEIELPIPELKTGDAVQIFAGCKRDLATCRDKYNNVINFGGSPRLPTRNLFLYGDRIL